ncbi:MAG: hypothetical protein PHP00_00505 [Thiotrichaceae bacterium]|nr:hypothetical protein [Thiotrichaceae bacterium]
MNSLSPYLTTLSDSRQSKGIRHQQTPTLMRGKKQVASDSYYISSEEVSAYRFGKWIQGV